MAKLFSKTAAQQLATLALAPVAILLSAPRAEAILRYYIFEQGGNTNTVAQGSITFTSAGTSTANPCGTNGGIELDSATSLIELCSGTNNGNISFFDIAPLSITGSPTFSSPTIGNAASSSGVSTFLSTNNNAIGLPLTYTSGASINSSSVYTGTFASNSIVPPISVPSLIGKFELVSGGDLIEVYFGTPPSTTTGVPAPLPLLGAASALVWSRKARARIRGI